MAKLKQNKVKNKQNLLKKQKPIVVFLTPLRNSGTHRKRRPLPLSFQTRGTALPCRGMYIKNIVIL